MSNRPAQRRAQEPSSRKQQDNFNRFAWRDAVFADKDVSAAQKCLAFGIAQHVNGETGEAVVSTVTLAKVCGSSETWVRKTIPSLAGTGWMQVQYGSKGRGKDHCNRYKVNPEKAHPVCDFPKLVKPHFSHLKAHPVCEEPLNHIGAPPARTYRMDRGGPTSIERARAFIGALGDDLPIDWEPDHASYRELSLLFSKGFTEQDLTARARSYIRHVSDTPSETMLPLAKWAHQQSLTSASS